MVAAELSGDRQSRWTPWPLGLFCLVLFLLPPDAVISFLPGAFAYPARLAAWVLVFLVIVRFVERRRRSFNGINPGAVVLLIYLLLGLTGLAMAFTTLSFAHAEEEKGRAIFTLIELTAVGLYALSEIKTDRQFYIVLGCLAVALSFNSLVALLQNIADIDLRQLLQPPGVTTRAVDPLLDARSVEERGLERAGVTRATGTVAHPIELAVLTAASVPLMAHLARYLNSRNARVAAWLGLLLALVSLPAGVSRSGLVALLAAMLVYMWGLRLHQIAAAVLTGALAFLALSALAPKSLAALWTTVAGATEDESVLIRISRITAVADSFRQHPLFGVGPGDGPKALHEYGPNGAVLPGPIDNEWFSTAVQGGAVGLAALATFVIAGVFGINASLRIASTRRQRDRAWALGAMFLAITSSSFTFDLFSFRQATLLYFVTFGLLWANFTIWKPLRAPGEMTWPTSTETAATSAGIPTGTPGTLPGRQTT